MKKLYGLKLFVSGIVDSSGIRLYVTQKLRKYDSAIMELGLEYTNKMAIPPRQSLFSLKGYCIPKCTEVVRNAIRKWW